MIPYGRQNINQDDIKAVTDVLKSDFLTQGPKVPIFEKKVAEKVGAKYSVALNSATSALHVACMALGLGPGDWLWTSPITFVASANCGIYCGARVDFVDIDPDTYNISIPALKKKLNKAREENKLPKVVVPVHLAGVPCDMEQINILSKEFGFRVIEDASHAIGGKYNKQYIGNCRFSDITVFSFHPVKIITTAEGGMATTNNKEFADSMSLHKTHGITKDPSRMENGSEGPWYYEQVELGYNYRMTDIQAALGISQLSRLDEYIAKRASLAKRYNDKLLHLPIKLPKEPDYSISAHHLYIIRLKLDKVTKTRVAIFNELLERKVGVSLHYIPVYSHPYYRALGFQKSNFPEAEAYYSECLSLPLHPQLSDEEHDYVIETLNEITLGSG